MKLLLYIGIPVVLVLSVFLYAYFYRGNSVDEIPGNPTEVPGEPSAFPDRIPLAHDLNNAGTVPLASTTGSTILREDSIRNSFESFGSGSYVYMGNGYTIEFQENGAPIVSTLTIIIGDVESFETARTDAESKLKEVTGHTEGELCQFDIPVLIHLPGYEGLKYGLSFCPGSVPLD
jgi:hypothetical protein